MAIRAPDGANKGGAQEEGTDQADRCRQEDGAEVFPHSGSTSNNPKIDPGPTLRKKWTYI